MTRPEETLESALASEDLKRIEWEKYPHGYMNDIIDHQITEVYKRHPVLWEIRREIGDAMPPSESALVRDLPQHRGIGLGPVNVGGNLESPDANDHFVFPRLDGFFSRNYILARLSKKPDTVINAIRKHWIHFAVDMDEWDRSRAKKAVIQYEKALDAAIAKVVGLEYLPEKPERRPAALEASKGPQNRGRS